MKYEFLCMNFVAYMNLILKIKKKNVVREILIESCRSIMLPV